ncbi:MAG: TrbC/VirB2 family protein [Cellvibrionales bacterium]|nr:TrbC/VirB2 family protein [Cellvibrionales bacterium]
MKVYQGSNFSQIITKAFGFVLFCTVTSLLFFADQTFAQSGITGLTGAENLIKLITDSLRGPIAKGVSLIAIVGLGFAAWSGRLTGALAVKIIVGIVIILGAAELINLVTGVAV